MTLMRALKSEIKKAGTPDLYGILRINHQHHKERRKTEKDVLWRTHVEGMFLVYVEDEYVLGYAELVFPEHQDSLVYVDDLLVDIRIDESDIALELYEAIRSQFPSKHIIERYSEKLLVM